MGWLATIGAAIGVLSGPAKFVVKELRGWAERRDQIQQATLGVELAKATAEAELAAYKVKADVEWDLAWAGQAQSSWKDEAVLILWTVPLLITYPALVWDGARDHLIETLQFFQMISPDILTYYLAGWSIIFAATFGIKGAAQMMVPGKVTSMVEALGKVEDDIPDDAVKAATDKIKELRTKVGLF